jgi:rod shape-determining protein MreC
MFQRADILPAVDTTKLEEVLVVGSQYQEAGSTVEGTR